MKKIIIILITAYFAIQNVNAQKFKVKKGVILKDKIEIGHTEGSLWKAGDKEVKIFGLKNELILTIKLNEYKFDNPLYKGYKWYDIKFGDTGKEVMINHLNSTTTSIPAILKNFTAKFEFEFNGSLIQNQDEIISKYNFKDELEADIKAKSNEDSQYAEILSKNEINRDRMQPIRYKTLQNSELIYRAAIMQDSIGIDPYRDDLVIGSFKREYKKDLGATVIKEVEYWFMERFEEPQSLENLTEYYAAATIIPNSTLIRECEVYTFVDKKIHKVKIENYLKAEREITEFLIENGYL